MTPPHRVIRRGFLMTAAVLNESGGVGGRSGSHPVCPSAKLLKHSLRKKGKRHLLNENTARRALLASGHDRPGGVGGGVHSSRLLNVQNISQTFFPTICFLTQLWANA